MLGLVLKLADFCKSEVQHSTDDNVGFPASSKYPHGRTASLSTSSFRSLDERLGVDQLLNLNVRCFKLLWLAVWVVEETLYLAASAVPILLIIFFPGVLKVPPSPIPNCALKHDMPVEAMRAASALLPLVSHAQSIYSRNEFLFLCIIPSSRKQNRRRSRCREMLPQVRFSTEKGGTNSSPLQCSQTPQPRSRTLRWPLCNAEVPLGGHYSTVMSTFELSQVYLVFRRLA